MATETLFHRRFDARARQAIAQSFGVTVKVISGAAETDSFTATIGRDDSAIDQSGPGARWFGAVDTRLRTRTQFASRVYYLPQASIVFNGATSEPKAGMVIAHLDDDEIVQDQYEILPEPNGPAATEVPGSLYWRVRAKKVTSAT